MQRIAELAAETQTDQLASALAAYDMLYAKQLAAGPYAEARQTLDSIVKLCGLAAPDRIELYDFSSYSDKQLAEEVARELPELIREAERLTRGTAEADQDQDGRPTSWIPHTPTTKQRSFSTAMPRRSSTAGRPAAAKPTPC